MESGEQSMSGNTPAAPNTKKLISRRTFLKGIGAAAGAGLTTLALEAVSPPNVANASSSGVDALKPVASSISFVENDHTPEPLKQLYLGYINKPPVIDNPTDADKPVEAGYGFATFYNRTNLMLPIAANNWFRYVAHGAPDFPEFRDRIAYLKKMWDPSSGQLSPEEALEKNLVIGFGAMRGNESAGTKYLLATHDPNTNRIQTKGWIFTIDCAAPHDFIKTYSKEKFAYGPCKDKPQSWLAESSAELWPELPDVPSPKGQRPGLILINESIVRQALGISKPDTSPSSAIPQ